MAVDAQGNLWVADSLNSRVLMYAKSSQGITTVATMVLGQSSFTSNRPGSGPCPTASRTALCVPRDVAVDTSGGPLNGTVYVSDAGDSRVLVWLNATGKPSTGGSADLVLGQSNFTSDGSNDVPPGTNEPDSCSTRPRIRVYARPICPAAIRRQRG